MASQKLVSTGLIAALGAAHKEVEDYAVQVCDDAGLRFVVTYLDNEQRGSSEGLRVHPGHGPGLSSGMGDLFLRFKPLKIDEITEPDRIGIDGYGFWSRVISQGAKCSSSTRFTYLTSAQVGAHYERFGGVRRMQETLEESLRNAGKIIGYQGEVMPAQET